MALDSSFFGPTAAEPFGATAMKTQPPFLHIQVDVQRNPQPAAKPLIGEAGRQGGGRFPRVDHGNDFQRIPDVGALTKGKQFPAFSVQSGEGPLHLPRGVDVIGITPPAGPTRERIGFSLGSRGIAHAPLRPRAPGKGVAQQPQELWVQPHVQRVAGRQHAEAPFAQFPHVPGHLPAPGRRL